MIVGSDADRLCLRKCKKNVLLLSLIRLLPPMPRCVLFVWFGYYRRCLAVFYSFGSVTTADASLCFIRLVRLLQPMPRCVLFVWFGYYRRCLAVFYSLGSVTTADASLCFSWLNELFIAVICSSSGSKCCSRGHMIAHAFGSCEV